MTISSANGIILGPHGIANSALRPVTLALPITLAIEQTWNSDSPGLLTVSGSIANGGNNLIISGSGGVTINGVLSGAGGGLQYQGTSVLTLNATNTYSGATNVNSGTLVLGVANALPTSTALGLGAAGALDLNGLSQQIGDLSGTGTIGNSSTSKPATLVFAGTAAASAFGGTIANGLHGAGSQPTSLTVTSGNLTLSGSNSYSGGTSLSGGTLTLNTDANLGATTSGITFNGGAFAFNSASPFAINPARPITVNATGGTLSNNNAWAAPTVTIGANISGPGVLTVNTEAWRIGTAIFSGNNSGFSGGIGQVGYGGTLNVLEFHGANSTGTGPIAFNIAYNTANLNLRNDTSTTFLASNVNPGASNTLNVNVDQLASGTGNTLTLNMLTANNDTINITGAHGYSLGIATLNMPAYQAATLSPATANVAIGTVSGGIGYYSGSPTLTLAGSGAGSGTIGAINLAGDNQNGQGIAVSSGSWTITGSGTYTAPTQVNGGTLILGNTAGSATGSGNVTLNGGQLATTVGTAGIIGGNVIAGTGAHSISPGGDGGIGSLAVGNLTLNANSTLRFDITSSSVHDQINDAGALNFNGSGAATILVPVLPIGSYKLMGFGSETVTSSNFNLDFITGGPTPPTYSLKFVGSEMDVLVTSATNSSTLKLDRTSVSLRTMQNQPVTAAVKLSETSGSMPSSFSTVVGPAVTLSPTSGTLAASGSQALTIGLADYSTLGARSDTVAVTNTANGSDPFNTGGNIIAISGAVVTNRVVTASSLTGGMHAGVGATASVTLSTTGDDNFFTRVTVGNLGTPDANGFTVTGGSNATFNSASVTDTRFLTSTTALTLGAVYSGSLTLTTNREGLPGESPINVSLPYNVTVFSGNANWTNAGGDNTWGNDANWTDASSTATLGAPGLSGAVSINDQAHFLGGGATLSLGNASPHLALLSFAGSG
ncbi:MAG: autotransporter-associated beta strand repeat-containing protein, partial [Thermoguttaceae bacterium]